MKRQTANAANEVFHKLAGTYGLQGWWPIEGRYHPGDYCIPGDGAGRYEVCVGAVLTQNTSWSNVEKALENLRSMRCLSCEGIDALGDAALKDAIRPAGYFNQKAKKIREFNRYYMGLGDDPPSREGLLGVWGVGPETADSIMLYAYHMPEFVVDAYTRRVFSRLGVIPDASSYEDIKGFFERSLEKDSGLYGEFHALVVEHSKRHCMKKPSCRGCPLHGSCERAI